MQSASPESPSPVQRHPFARIPVIDALRGLASFAVCWYHLVFAAGTFAGGGIVAAALRDSARNAWVGVEIFFVISGFVIPLALFRSRYSVRSYGRFMLKRIVRLDPPYLVSAALCLVLWYIWAAIPHLHGQAFKPSTGPLLLHVGYLNALFGQRWLNAVYWTLAIEFQYYLGMGLVYAALASTRWQVRYGAYLGMGALAFLIPDDKLVFHYLFVFMLGVCTFQYFAGLLPLRGYLVLLLVVLIGCDLTLGPMVAGVSGATALVIACVRRPIPVLGSLGTISYSLYLLHIPVGGRILGLGLSHVQSGPARILVLLGSLVATIAAAWVFYLAVERPAQRWSSAVRYGARSGHRRARGAERHAPVATGIAEP